MRYSVEEARPVAQQGQGVQYLGAVAVGVAGFQDEAVINIHSGGRQRINKVASLAGVNEQQLAAVRVDAHGVAVCAAERAGPVINKDLL
jgi:hypothetical protein